MTYPKVPNYHHVADVIRDYSSLKHELGSQGVQDILDHVYEEMQNAVKKLDNLAIDKALSNQEPNDLQHIRNLRPSGPRKLWTTWDEEKYKDKLEGAFLARMAGCTLGAPVEFWSIQEMKNWATYIGDTFPPVDYWSKIKQPYELRYSKGDFIYYTRDEMHKVPVDDDITYTILSLMIVENYGADFTTEDVGKAWLKHLPLACTAEEIALNNLKQNMQANNCAEYDNPYSQWIGADIRSDGFAYMAPAYPQKAAQMAYYDAYLSHRRNGIYGEMFFAAAQSAAFAVDDAVEALKIGLTEIPAQCKLAEDVTWAMEIGKTIANYQEARDAVDQRFEGMSHAHTNNNACLTIFGLMIGGHDVTKVISETVAMGMDNDCTAATAGSIVGAIVGKKGVSEHWYKNFNNTVDTYLTHIGEVNIDDMLMRFTKQAKTVYKV
ncbi:ADP-ribosylglycohydrolase family protein [Longirhabdus pacifica]|uniref:ADP-ribosylglycohydrolase family protein n=1 Tax=Longirhabdus pacifica TaxID=2305227 RepID=UPI0010089923|nr:ADP-ribosylglycohydrolase family protein [Longirhabdus pacifica]